MHSVIRILTILIIFIISIFHYSCKDDKVVNPNTGTTIYDLYPAYFPNGNTIVYSGGPNPNASAIYSVNSEGTNQHLIASEFGQNCTWSPDEQWFAYDLGGNIFKRKINDTIVIQLTFSGHNFFPSWSKDGLWIAYDSDDDSPNGASFIWKMREDGTQKKRIFYTPTIGAVREPCWFPDSKRLAVSRYVGHGAPEIAIIDTLGNDIAVLTDNRITERGPKISPDGNYIVFERQTNNGQIIIMKVDGSDETVVNSQYSKYPNWSPDGSMLTYTNCISGNGRIWTMTTTGQNKKQLSF